MHDSDLEFFSEISAENLVTFKRAPRVRVKMVDQQESLDFEVRGGFIVTDEQDNVISDDFETSGSWRARVDAFTPPTYQYLLFVIELFHIEKAKEIAEDLKKRGFQAWYKSFGYRVQLSSEEDLFDVLRYRVFIGPVPYKQKARSIQTQLLGVFSAQILKIPYRHTRGKLEIIDLQNADSLKGTGFIRLKPKSSSGRITVHGIRNLEKRMPYTFRNAVEFHVAESGKLYLVGEMDIEEYITGLMTALFNPEYPVEFLKVISMTYRSSILSNLGMSHINEPYDYHISEHYFKFAWQTSVPPKLRSILQETAGKYFLKGDRICDTQHTLVCGGHTEHIDIVMNRDTRNSITGRYDVVNSKKTDYPLNLSNEIDAENWIRQRPETLCNFRNQKFDENFELFNNYFRWVVEYSRHDLEEIVCKKTGEDIGTIYDIVPLLRGGSGRLLELEVLCSHRNVHLIGDHEIRSCLAEDMLPSSYFIIEAKPGVNGTAAQFIFIGAGKGHGVGLCQAGAIAMAHDGFDSMKIIEHYFGQVNLVSRHL